tara:strand:+ start:3994 stop:4185 length:192 start_codon:yes stop_codon:yes gene_type:complete
MECTTLPYVTAMDGVGSDVKAMDFVIAAANLKSIHPPKMYLWMCDIAQRDRYVQDMASKRYRS